MLLGTNKSGTVLAEKTVQHVTRNYMVDSKAAAQVENINTAINELLDELFFRIQHREGGLTFKR